MTRSDPSASLGQESSRRPSARGSPSASRTPFVRGIAAGSARVGWEHALDAEGPGYSTAGAPPRPGNDLEVLIDGSNALPAIAEELARAESHVHLSGWYLSPHLELTRGDDPVVLRNLLAELAERVDVRVLLWGGAPIRLFRPSRTDVRLVRDQLCGQTEIQCEIDSCVGPLHCHHEKTIVIDDRVAFVGGIDLTLDAGDPYDTPEHVARGRIGWHDAAVRLRGPAVTDVAEHFRLRWEAARDEPLAPPEPQGSQGDVEVQVVRTVRDGVFAKLPRGDYSLLEAYTAALRSAEHFVYLENQFLWSPEIVEILAEKLRNPPRGRLPHPPAPARAGQRRRGRVLRSGGGADRRRRRERPLPRLHALRADREPPRSRVRARQDRDRRRPLAHASALRTSTRTRSSTTPS